ncbi:MAG: hypothetical protein ABFS32_11680 [Bacteroidota bacterium]
MRTITKLLVLAISAMAFAFVTSCEGPEGPAGADGTDGTNGVDGIDGQNGNVSCLVCHSQSSMDALNALYALSGHNAAGAVAYAGGRASCAKCHSHEGFSNYLAATPGADAIDIAYPTRIGCKTCHSTHTSLEADITAPMATTAAVTAITDGSTFDFVNNSNLCANCHQSRKDGDSYDKYTDAQSFTRKFTGDNIAAYTTSANGPAGSATLNATSDTLTVVFDVPTTHVYISSSHAGPHHGPQANVLFGIGGYGSGSTGTHSTLGCVSCHLGTAGTTEGGHSFIPNVDNCTSCHTGATDFDWHGKQTSFDTRLAAIEAALETAHAIHVDAGEVHPMYSSITREEFKAFWNFMILLEDASRGVHNPGYTETLLTSAETNLGL